MIQYTIVKKKVLTGSHPGEIKYYPKIVRAKTIDTDEIAELLQQRTTLGESEVRAFLNGLSQAIRYYVCASYPVEVEGLGRFTPSIKAKAMDSPEAVTAATITHKGVNYSPTMEMKRKLEKVKFVKADLKSAHYL